MKVKFNIYSVRDAVACVYYPGFYCVNDNEAIRAYQLVAADKASFFGSRQDDFCLVKIGVFDNETGEVENVKNVIIYPTALKEKEEHFEEGERS